MQKHDRDTFSVELIYEAIQKKTFFPYKNRKIVHNCPLYQDVNKWAWRGR